MSGRSLTTESEPGFVGCMGSTMIHLVYPMHPRNPGSDSGVRQYTSIGLLEIGGLEFSEDAVGLDPDVIGAEDGPDGEERVGGFGARAETLALGEVHRAGA